MRAADYLRSATRPSVHTWTEKSQHDFVTEVDRAAEGLITEELTRAEPDSVIVGEELSPERAARGELVWIVDPLDGTTNYLQLSTVRRQHRLSRRRQIGGRRDSRRLPETTYRATHGGGASRRTPG